ncbi:MAG TPA: PASTA domain-containing protein [Synergistaceae bacterium]|nr:PASTA domain-containing protein [Synergistaceae bacterium]HPQ37949.1 PASTA domain-containing protein [Synergistaceae bacterium]
MRKLFFVTLTLVLIVILSSAALIFYMIFFGGKEIASPALEGMAVIEAVGHVQSAGLVARVDQVDSAKKEGIVVAQWPAPGSLMKKGQVLILKVSKGGQRYPLPDVRNMEYGLAVKTLTESGFVPGDVLRAPRDGAAPGTVIAQNPSSPVALPRGARVDLLLCQGEENASGTVKVPNLSGRMEDEAKTLIRRAGLSLGSLRYHYTQASPPGVVIRISPKEGTSVKKNTPVNLVVSTMKKASSGEGEKPAVPTPAASAPEVKTPSIPGVVVSPGALGEVTSQITPTPAPKPTKAPLPGDSVDAPKKAKIRYQVPPLSKPLRLSIELVDAKGSKKLVDKEVAGGEYISMEVPYVKEAAVTIYLGGEFVWQERYR